MKNEECDLIVNAGIRTVGKPNTTIKHTVKHKGQTHNRQVDVAHPQNPNAARRR